MKKLYFLFSAMLLLAGSAQAQLAHVNAMTTDAPPAGRSVVSPAPAAAISPDSVFIAPNQLPQFTGGPAALQAFLAKNLRYPAQAKRMHAEGQVFVRFIVNAEGRISDVTVLRGPGYGLNEEALRLVWFMPPWQPGKHHGQTVKTACTLPISFQ